MCVYCLCCLCPIVYLLPQARRYVNSSVRLQAHRVLRSAARAAYGPSLYDQKGQPITTAVEGLLADGAYYGTDYTDGRFIEVIHTYVRWREELNESVLSFEVNLSVNELAYITLEVRLPAFVVMSIQQLGLQYNCGGNHLFSVRVWTFV